jgi:hypothetical protein
MNFYFSLFNSEPKRYKSVSLSAKRSVLTLVGLGHGVVTEKLRFPYNSQQSRGRPRKTIIFHVFRKIHTDLIRFGIPGLVNHVSMFVGNFQILKYQVDRNTKSFRPFDSGYR